MPIGAGQDTDAFVVNPLVKGTADEALATPVSTHTYATPEEQLLNSRIQVLFTLNALETPKLTAREVLRDAQNLAGAMKKASSGGKESSESSSSDPSESPPSPEEKKSRAERFFDQVVADAKAAMNAVGDELDSVLAEIKQSVLGELVSAALPFKDAALKAKTAATSFWDTYKLHASAANVSFQKGHSGNIAETIEKLMTARALGAVAKLALSTAEAAFKVATVGVGTAITAVAKVLFLVFETVKRYMDIHSIATALKSAKTEWDGHKSPNSVVRNPDRFGEWIEGVTKKAPILAAALIAVGAAGPVEAMVELFPGPASGKGLSASQEKQVAEQKRRDGLKAKKNLSSASANLLNESPIKVSFAKGAGTDYLNALLEHGKEAALVQSESGKVSGLFSRLAMTVGDKLHLSKASTDKVVKTSTILQKVDTRTETLTMNPAFGLTPFNALAAHHKSGANPALMAGYKGPNTSSAGLAAAVPAHKKGLKIGP